jgi:flavin-dependent dehydrogenase
MADPFSLEDGSRIAVIGGGPTGSFFSIFALKMAKMMGKDLNVTIYEPKDFTRDGPAGCNRCGGVISELLVQNLAVEGIILPESLVQRGINSYKLYTAHGKVLIETPTFERTIATIYRGGGPKGTAGKDKESFDNFLLNAAVREGAVHVPLKIDRIEYKNGRPVLFSKDEKISEPELVVGAIGVKSNTSKIFEEMGFGYKRPETVTAAIAEIDIEGHTVSEIFGNSVHLFLLPMKGIKFAAMVPKGAYVTVCILGQNMNINSVSEFLDHTVVKSILPKDGLFKIECRCLPKMNVQAPVSPFTDRVVLCGDAGSTRLFKDGIGAAYIMGKAAARTAVFQGVGKEHFLKEYYPVYKSIINDNLFGKFLFSVTDIVKEYKALTKGMLAVVQKEQEDTDNQKVMSSILWDMFTGNERYRNIFMRSMNVRMNLGLMGRIAKALIMH